MADGFPVSATRFFAGLEEDNSKAYWEAHRDTFARDVVEPMAALLDSLPERYQPFRVFRMNRDLRFTADKTPYKTMHGAVHEEDGAVHYLHLDSAGLLVACGVYLMSASQLERYRAAVADNRTGPALLRLLAQVRELGLDTGPGGAAPLKTAPRGYAREHPRIELLRQKGVIASATLTGRGLRDAMQVRQFVVDTFAAAEPLQRWLRRQVGADAPQQVGEAHP